MWSKKCPSSLPALPPPCSSFFFQPNIPVTNNSSQRLYEEASGLSRQASLQPGVIRTGVNLEAKF
jgi:hypothetical protein